MKPELAVNVKAVFPNPDRKKKLRKNILTVLRWLMGTSLLVILFRIADVQEISEILRGANLGLFLFIVIWQFLDRMLQAWRWDLLLKTKIKDVSSIDVFQVHFISSFLGNFLPFSIGSDVTRVVVLAKRTENLAHVASSVIIDRVIGVSALAFMVLLSLIGVIWGASSTISSSLVWVITGGLIAFVSISILCWKGKGFWTVVPILKRMSSVRFFARMGEVYDACLEYSKYRNVVAKVFSITILSWINGIFTTYFAGMLLGINIALMYYFLFIPIIYFLVQIPISANGIGIQEGGFVFFFSQVGASTSEALMLGLVIRIVMTLVTVPGGLLLAFRGWPSGEPVKEY